MIEKKTLRSHFENFETQRPFSYAVIDNFFPADLANQLSSEFPDFNDPVWHEYKNQIEIKKVSNNWNTFPKATYEVFSYLNSAPFLDMLMDVTGIPALYPDNGLNGGGWHIHANGGKLNPHLDYSMHPKLPYQRKINIIVYLQTQWQSDWGGHLGLYEHDASTNKPGRLVHEIEPLFNRAVFFDTTQNSWHGLCREVATPNGICRKSMAIYYLTTPPKGVDPRGKALFAPTDDQESNQEVLDLIKKRADINQASSVYNDRR
jgi:Rps23 Pro-64 3,4-dihydroxylase Tpa1-like proline 4-hydroxylase